MFLTPDGRINCPAVPELHGLDRFEAREKAAELLQEKGLLSKTEPHENNVGFSERSEVPIEPRISEQWFLALSENEGSARRRARSSHPLLSRALGKGLRAMAGEHSGLVHQPAGLVGTPDTGVVSEISNSKFQIPNLRRD